MSNQPVHSGFTFSDTHRDDPNTLASPADAVYPFPTSTSRLAVNQSVGLARLKTRLFGTRRAAVFPKDTQELIRSELFGIERLEQHAESLAAAQRITGDHTSRRRLARRDPDERATAQARAQGGGRRTAPLWGRRWWGGRGVLPLEAYASVGSIPVGLFALIPLSGLIALGLHFANALPDVDADRVAGRHSLPVIVGVGGSRWGGPAALVAAVVLALALAGPLGQAGWVWFGGVSVLALGLVAVTASRSRRPFSILAVATSARASAALAPVTSTSYVGGGW